MRNRPRATEQCSSYHPVPLVLYRVDEPAELLQRVRYDDLVVRLAVADALELEIHQAVGQAALRSRQRCRNERVYVRSWSTRSPRGTETGPGHSKWSILTSGGVDEVLHLLDEALDGQARLLQLLLVGVQLLPEVRAVRHAVRELQRLQPHGDALRLRFPLAKRTNLTVRHLLPTLRFVYKHCLSKSYVTLKLPLQRRKKSLVTNNARSLLTISINNSRQRVFGADGALQIYITIYFIYEARLTFGR